jgi:hypothetical protein
MSGFVEKQNTGIVRGARGESDMATLLNVLASYDVLWEGRRNEPLNPWTRLGIKKGRSLP